MSNYNRSLLVSLAADELAERVKNLPISLSVSDVAEFLGVCLTTAYIIVGKPDFPKKKIKGVRRHIIPKVKFVEWYLSEKQD